MARQVVVLGIPSAAGARFAGAENAPAALRAAGLLEALRAAGAETRDLGDLPRVPHRDDPESPQARNVPAAAQAAGMAAEGVERAVREGFALVLGGDCSLCAGTVAGARRALDQPVGLVFLDADADLNTPDTSPSGCLHGMALSLALGRGPEAVAAAGGPPPATIPEHVALVGFRALDPGERHAIGYLGLALPAAPARRLGMPATAALALDAVENGEGPLVVHFDVDLIDPDEMPAKATLTPGEGLSFAEASDLLTALLASPRVVALEVAEYDPGRDPGTVAPRLVEMLARAVGRHVRADR
jgi:arginase